MENQGRGGERKFKILTSLKWLMMESKLANRIDDFEKRTV